MIQKLIRPNIQNLTPYSSARNEYGGHAEVWLDANENPFNTGLNRYPDPFQRALKDEIARNQNMDASRIILGNGSDELIDLLIRVFCEPRMHQVIVFPPTYGMYQVCAHINDVEVIKIPQLPGFKIDHTSLHESITDATRIMFIGSPNNPTGNALDQIQLENILKLFKGIVVLDEAYIDFVPGGSLLPLIQGHPNLVVLQTFSKAWGMAGIRLGVGFGSTELIQVLNRIKPPYNINSMTQKEALKVLQRVDTKKHHVQIILQQKEWLYNTLTQLSIVAEVFPSDANFLLVRFRIPIPELYHHLLTHHIVVRDRSREWLCDGCMRITVGTPAENKYLIKVIKEFSNEESTFHRP